MFNLIKKKMKKETMFIIGAVALGFIGTRFYLKSKEDNKSSFSGINSKQTYFCSSTGNVYRIGSIAELNKAKSKCMVSGGTLTKGLWGLTGGRYALAEEQSSACGCGA